MDLASFDLLNPQANMLDGLIGRSLLTSSDTPSSTDTELPGFQAMLQDEADVLLTQAEPRSKSLAAAVQLAMTEQSQQPGNLKPASSPRNMSGASTGHPVRGLSEQTTEPPAQPVAPPVNAKSGSHAEILPNGTDGSVDANVSINTTMTSDHTRLPEPLLREVEGVGKDADADLKASSHLLAVAYNPAVESRVTTVAPVANTSANSSVASASLLHARTNAQPPASQTYAAASVNDSKEWTDTGQSATARLSVLNPVSISLTQTQLAQTQRFQTQPTGEQLSKSLVNRGEPAQSATQIRGCSSRGARFSTG